MSKISKISKCSKIDETSYHCRLSSLHATFEVGISKMATVAMETGKMSKIPKML